MTKIQLNNRLKPEIVTAVTQVREAVPFSKDELAEVAWASLLGSRDPLIEAKRSKINQVVKQLKIKLTFNGESHSAAIHFSPV